MAAAQKCFAVLVPEDVFDLLHNVLASVVEVRLSGQELVQVELASLLTILPHGLSEHANLEKRKWSSLQDRPLMSLSAMFRKPLKRIMLKVHLLQLVK